MPLGPTQLGGRYRTGELATANFRELLFHALGGIAPIERRGVTGYW